VREGVAARPGSHALNALICKEKPMSGYNNPYVLLEFPNLGDDVSVLIRNPQLMPPAQLQPRDVAVDENGQPVDQEAARQASYEVMERLIVAWKVYEAFEGEIEVAEDADPTELFQQLTVGEPKRLGKINTDSIGRLPLAILNRIGEEVGRVADPQ
jgi:hypothetical protein